MKKRKWLAVLTLSAMLVAAGCSPNANQQKPAEGQKQPDQQQAQSPVGKAITIAYSEGGTTMDPAMASDLTSDTLIVSTYDQLVQFGTKNVDGTDIADTEVVKPMLAKEWKISDDKLTYTFTLRDDVKFHSGNPVNAEAVVFSMDHLKNGQSSIFKLSGIETVTAKDATTVELKLRKPNPLLLQYLAQYNFSIIDPSVIKEKGDDYLKNNAAGSGPFKLEKWDPASEAILVANTDYWQGAPKVEKVTMKFTKEASSRVLLLGKGDVDLAIEIPAKDVDSLKQNENVQVHSNPSNRILYFAMNNKVKPFDDARVRQAIAYAIPYDKLINDVMYGQAKQLKSAVPSNTPGSTDAGFVYKNDLEKAKQLLKEAGYENGFSFDFTLGSGFQDWEDDAVLIQAELEKIGVKMDIKKVARAQFLQMQKEKNLTSFMSKWTSFVNDPGYHLGFLLYGKGSSNYINYQNAKVDELWEKADVESDPVKRYEMYKEAQEIITSEAPWAYLYEYNRVVGVNKNLKGYSFYPDEIIRFYPLSKE
ncbi:ABC transporter substrate-binding protein [Brevibacillus ruminantium]|uniref:ABC transporter substrate-binding protein n=1 Tax=Brevibacillus ruminantium TaxID=2950604 RepID=A0ABY4WGF1_9BACL|nr:ABC transporter substrate-binding protein [Brevibacillus ruminantium]USG66245.1 ABC transporter substrate-binding protein [Brevibacillus ruminantium]